MFKHAKYFLLAAMAVLMTSSIASAAIFETHQPLPKANSPAIAPYPHGGRTQSLYQLGSLDHAGDLQFSLAKAEFTRQEDLFWVAVGNATLFSLQPLASNAAVALHPVESDHFRTPKENIDSAVRPTSEGAAPKAWAVILIGAGLVWTQLRRRNRRGAIHFTTG
jgi:hypothetical protein